VDTTNMKTSNLRSSVRGLCAIAGLAVFASCVEVPKPDPLPAAPVITTFSASKGEVTPGEMVTLTWKVENATSVKIDELELGSLSGVSGNEGTVDVSVGKDSLFVLTARNERGASDTAAVAVRVTSSAGELLLTLLPTTISAGESATLAWSAPGATSVTITADPGGALDLQGQTSVGVSIVKPSASTVYTLTANGRTATVALTIQPTLLSFEASSLSADAGSTVTLAWESVNATRLQLSAPGRGTLLDTMDVARIASGTFDDTLPAVVDPGQVFSYQLTVTGSGVTLTDSVVVSVKGNPAVLTFTSPKYSRDPAAGPLPDGGTPSPTIRLAWTTRESDTVSIAANGVEFYRAPTGLVLAGTVDLPAPSIDTTYLLTARATRGGTATSTTSVDVVGLPTVTLTATPNSVMAGEPFTLQWTGSDVRNVKIGAPGLPLFTGRDVMASGSPTGSFALGETTTLRLDADNGVGDQVSTTATVTVTSAFNVMSNASGTLRSGQTIELSWAGGGTATGFTHNAATSRVGSGEFDDISTTGTPLVFTTTGDGVAFFDPPDFKAPFFDREVGSRVWVSTNGFLSFTRINPSNNSEVTLPTAKLEPYSIAPNWDDTSISSATTSVYWQVKPENGGQLLIVMWKTVSSKTYEVKLHSNGQIDIEYLVWSGTPGKGGVQGPRADWGYPLPGVPANNTTMTFFGPKASPLSIDVRQAGVLRGFVAPSGSSFSATYTVPSVVRAHEFTISEALSSPQPAVGAQGVWYELFNNSTGVVDLAGWGLSVADGGIAPLSGSLDAGATLVVGITTDGALNDDAGVQLAVSPLAFDAGSASLVRGGVHATVALGSAQSGVAVNNDPGPFLLSSDTSTTAPHPQTCLATESFGFQTPSQLGSPGAARDCGFGYRVLEIPEKFRDIKTTGTQLTISDYDEDVIPFSLTAAPFPFFGVAQTQLHIAMNGYVSFDGVTTSSLMSGTTPTTADPNALIAVFGDDLEGYWLESEIYTERIGANVDPLTPAPHWIIQWDRWSHYVAADSLYFQLKLFDDGTAEVHFADMFSGSSSQYGSGISAVTWLENLAGDQALVVNANSASPGIVPHTAFRFVPR
jgi:hypothetical protein